MVHNDISDGRNINTAEQSWNSSIEFGDTSNVHKLVEALLSAADDIDDTLGDVYDNHHIDTATGQALDQFGALVNTPRNSGEPDDKYRTRIKAEFAQSNTTTDFNAFVQFCASVLGTDEQNITFSTNYKINPATITVSAPTSIYDSLTLDEQEVEEILGGGVPAGHSVKPLRKGTFRVRSDEEFDNADKGLTSDDIETGGTLAADLVE